MVDGPLLASLKEVRDPGEEEGGPYTVSLQNSLLLLLSTTKI